MSICDLDTIISCVGSLSAGDKCRLISTLVDESGESENSPLALAAAALRAAIERLEADRG